MLVNPLIITRFKRDLLNDLANEIGNVQSILNAVARRPCFLARNLDTELNLFWIVRRDFRADAILELLTLQAGVETQH